MSMSVMYTPYGTSLREQTGDIIMFAQFEEKNIWSKSRSDAESDDKYDNKSIRLNEQDMDAMNYDDESDHDLISTEMLEEICDISQC